LPKLPKLIIEKLKQRSAFAARDINPGTRFKILAMAILAIL